MTWGFVALPAPVRPASQRARLAMLRAAGASYSRPHGGRAPASVLLIRPDHLGDVLLLTPALHALRQALPAARLTLLVGPWGAEAVRSSPDVDSAEICRFPGFERQPKAGILAPYRLLFEAAGRLRGRFDTSVVLRYDHWWGAWLAAAAGIPRRVGYHWPETQPFLTEAIRYQPELHEARQNARLLEALAPGIEENLGPSRYNVPEEDRNWAMERLNGLGSRPWVAIHPGAGAAVKQWPPEYWAMVAAGIRAATGAEVLLTGGAGERELAAAVSGHLQAGTGPYGPLDLAGATTFGQLAAIYQQCDLVLGSDSGPLHLAVAAGARTVHLYGPAPAAKFGPWGDPTRNLVLQSPFLCAPCDRLDWPEHVLPLHGCMAAIRPVQVIDAALRLLVQQATVDR